MRVSYLKNRLIGRYIPKNYVVAKLIRKALFYLSNRFKLSNAHPPLLIYQMGKVGSQSIYQSIKRCGITSPVYHIHVIAKKNLVALDRIIRNSYALTNHIPEHLIAGEFFRPIIRNSSPKLKFIVITLIRDPIARNISSFFEDLRTRHPYLDYHALLQNKDIDGAKKILINAFLENHDHLKPLNWFDEELNNVLKIDIFSKPFDKENGYEIYCNDLCRVLFIKLEKLNQCAKSALPQFLMTDAFQLIHKNISIDKKYGELYYAVSQSIAVPDDYIDMIYNSKLVQHVYTEGEIKQFKDNWHSND